MGRRKISVYFEKVFIHLEYSPITCPKNETGTGGREIAPVVNEKKQKKNK